MSKFDSIKSFITIMIFWGIAEKLFSYYKTRKILYNITWPPFHFLKGLPQVNADYSYHH